MRRTIDLTLAIPLYNSASNLPELLQSLEMQLIMPEEIIFLDDASTDCSREIVEQFSRKHLELNIQIYSNPENLGIAGTYNKLALLANRQWVQILDADDYLIGDFFWTIEKYMTGGIVAIVSGMRSNITFISLVNRLFAEFIPVKLPYFLPMLGSFAPRSGIIYSACLLKDHLFIDPVFDGSDLLHFFEFRQLGTCIYVPKAVLYYNVHGTNFSNRVSSNKYLEALKNRKDIPITYTIDFFLRKRVFGFLRRYEQF